MNIILNYPDRAPLDVCKVITPMIRGRTICDLGCGSGDILELIKYDCKKVFGYEKNLEKCKKAWNEGRDYVIYKDIIDGVEEADIYLLNLDMIVGEHLRFHIELLKKLSGEVLFLSLNNKQIKFLELLPITIINIYQYQFYEYKESISNVVHCKIHNVKN